MAGNIQTNEAGITAPDQGITTAPETVETPSHEQELGESTGEEEGEPKPPKTFTQEELDRIVAKEKAAAERKAKREIAARVQQAQQQTAPTERPTIDQFESPEDYAEALSEWKAEQKIQQQRQVQQRTEADRSFDERVEAAMDKYDDFEEVAYSQSHRVTGEMADVIKASEVGPELAYWLGKNPSESNRIAELPPLQQARELGKIEAKLIAEPPVPVKKPSAAPAPINPVTAHRTNATTFDTTDPRSDKMSDSDWIKAENERLRRKFQAQ